MSLIKLKINPKPIDYDITIGSEIVSKELLAIIKSHSYSKILIIHDSKINLHFVSCIKEDLLKSNLQFKSFEINSTKDAKSFNTYSSIIKFLILNKYNKDSLLISVGGGTVGDVVAFTASTFYRGVDYIQIPTTLLSMIDSSIGGKTGIDTKFGKNIIGSFYHPKRVIIDMSYLTSLSKNEFNSGMFEVVKYSILFSENLFDFIDTNFYQINKEDIIKKIIIDCCNYKSYIVSRDERDISERKKLNFGHTVGHAIETIYGLRHGESVGYGMLCAAKISQQVGTLSKLKYEKITTLIRRISLPKIKLDSNKIINQLQNDKKVENNKNIFILLNDIGNSYISDKINKQTIENSILNL